MPIFRQTVAIQAMSSILALKDRLYENDILSSFVYVDSFDIVTARNMIATHFHRMQQYTHLLFIDDDMSFDAADILYLLEAKKPFSGCVCPKRNVDLKRFSQSLSENKSFDEAYATALDFVVTHRKAQELVVTNNLCSLRSIGMAVTLIERSVFDRLITTKSVDRIELEKDAKEDWLGNPFQYGFFSRIYSEDLNGWYGEDFSFCHRWTEGCSGEIFGLVTAKIGHVGNYVYQGRYIDSLKGGRL